ncbi:rab11 family-interacting protein 1-like isoform X2 [Hemiscyllium ocellatum]|uniref:rab11 family-interacting protein 1-like isoform X2 n=1 Tax=Hemiscyllium ocellatum TaxID=170820 RepID=UPI00296778B0|nr:rab11 family-interacting protein 1-like isoform X2 [Hemiscyllium ocellatum]
MAGILALQSPHWLPSHVQVTVLRARGLRAKGKHNSSDAFAIIQLGKERYCTSVQEQSREPEWKEECIFEVLPDWLLEAEGGGHAAGKELLITIMHRSLLAMDKFLGQLALPLAAAYQQKTSRKPEWYRLSSKPGQKEKERGEIQVIIEFVRNNMTASMFDLSSKEKPRSALGKLKDRVKGKKKLDNPLMAESASAIVSSSVGQIISDEEFNEKETLQKRPKKGFFSKPKLHRSSLTKSNSSLSSQQSVKSLESVSSSTGPVTVTSPKATGAPSGFHSLFNETNDNPSLPKKMTHKRALSDEVGQTNVPNIEGLAPKTSPLSRSSLCINGSHIYSEEPASKSPSNLFPELTSLSHSSQDIASKKEPPPWPSSLDEPEATSRDTTKMEARLIPPVIRVADEEGAPVLTGDSQKKEEVKSTWSPKPIHAAAPIISTVEPTKNIPDETKKASIFPFGSESKDSKSKRSRTPSPVRKCSSLAEKSKGSGWFVKDANPKPSLNFGSQGVPDVSVPSSSTADSSESDLFDLAKPIANEEVAASPLPAPASTMTRESTNSFQRLETSDPLVNPGSADADAEVKGEVMHAPLAQTSVLSTVDLKVTVPFKTKQMKTVYQGEAECSSMFVPAVDHKTVDMNPSVPTPNTTSIHVNNSSGSTSKNISGQQANSKPKNDGSSNIMLKGTTTDNAKPLDIRTCSLQDTTLSPSIELPFKVEGGSSSPMIQNAALNKERHVSVPELKTELEPNTECDSCFTDQEKITNNHNVEKLSALKESDRNPRDTAKHSEGCQHVGNSPLSVYAPEVTTDESDGTTRANNRKANIVPLFQDGEDNIQGNVCPFSSQGFLGKDDKQYSKYGQCVLTVEHKFQNVDIPCEDANESPETIEAEKERSEFLFKSDSEFIRIGPPPPKPPRSLVCTNLGLEEMVHLMKEQKREKEMPFDLPESSAQTVNLAERQSDQRFEQKASLVVSCPAVDEVNPDRTDFIAAESAAKELVDNIRPSNDVVTKGEASYGTVELSANERTGVEYYKTCLSALSVEGINTLIDDGNSNKLDDFHQPLSLGLIEVHQAKQPVKLQPSLLKTTAAVNSLEAISPAEEKPPPVQKSCNAFLKEEASLFLPDQTDQSEQEFISAVEELPHKSSPILSECTMSLGSDIEFSGELKSEMSEAAGKSRGASTLTNPEQTLIGNMEVETQNGRNIKTVCQSVGVRPSPSCVPVTLGAEMEQQSRGEEANLAEHSPPDLCPSLTVRFDWGQISEKANGVAYKSEPSAQNVDLQSISNSRPVTEDRSLSVPHGYSAACDSSFKGGLSFKELHLKAAPHALPVTNFTRAPLAHPPPSNKPLAFSTPYPVAVTNSRVPNLPSPIFFPSNVIPPSETTQPAVTPHHSLQSSGSKVTPLTVLPRETQPAEMPSPQQKISPHPVKPISNTVQITEKKSGLSGIGSTLSSGLEKLKNVTTGSNSPTRSPTPGQEEQEAVKESKPTDPVARYYHLTHDELIKIILQQELEMKKKEEHVRDLEEYIDIVLVQVMEQKPSILQAVSEKMKNKAVNK